jgi:hypothetical protein
MTTAWRKAGSRCLLHKGYPKFVVRFTRWGVGTGKLLCNLQEFEQIELAAGRVPERSLEILVQDAEKAWQELNKPKPDN